MIHRIHIALLIDLVGSQFPCGGNERQRLTFKARLYRILPAQFGLQIFLGLLDPGMASQKRQVGQSQVLGQSGEVTLASEIQ